MKLILIFLTLWKKKIQVDKNGCKYLSLRIDVYFKFLLAVETDEKGHTDIIRKKTWL